MIQIMKCEWRIEDYTFGDLFDNADLLLGKFIYKNMTILHSDLFCLIDFAIVQNCARY